MCPDNNTVVLDNSKRGSQLPSVSNTRELEAHWLGGVLYHSDLWRSSILMYTVSSAQVPRCPQPSAKVA